MLGLDQVQRMNLRQKELRIQENKQPVSYYPLKLESTGGSSYSIARRPSCPPRSHRSSQISLKKHKPAKVSRNLDYSCIDSTYDQKRYQLIRKRLEFCLELAGRKHLMCSMSIPYNLLNKISQDVLRMSKSEPSGLNACLIHVELKELDDCVHHIGQIGFDTQTTATMVLRLRLHRDAGGDKAPLSTRIQKFVSRVISHNKKGAGGSCSLGAATGEVIDISPGFQLVKEKSSSSSNSLLSAMSTASIASAPSSIGEQPHVNKDESSTDSNDSGIGNNDDNDDGNENDENDDDNNRLERFSGDSSQTNQSSRRSSRGRR